MHMYIILIDEKKSHEFEREQGGVYGKVWWEGGGGGNDLAIISKNIKF